jgi:hypothetical protein
MKKRIIVALLLISGLAFSSCHRNKCPSFSQVNTSAEEARV